MIAREALMTMLTTHDVDKLCKRHLANRARIKAQLTDAPIVRYKAQESQRFKPAHPHVAALLIERIDFDRAFRTLAKREQKVLLAWYGFEGIKPEELASHWGCSRSTVFRRRVRAIASLRDNMNLIRFTVGLDR